MLSHRLTPGPRTSGARTGQPGPPWRPWHSAWVDAAYGPDGFWSSEQPGDHFTTGVAVGGLVAAAVAGMLPAGGSVVVDVGAGDGRLLAGLTGVLPHVALVGVDRRARPPGLDPRVRWVVDHWDAVSGWTNGGPDAWTEEADVPLLVAHEWLDDLPVPVVARTGGGAADGWREVEVDPAGEERLGGPVRPADAAWLETWWPDGARAEVGRGRDGAWAALVRAAMQRGGRALAVDYGHQVRDRPVGGTFAAYAGGRRRSPVPDGSVNLTAGVAVDALAAAGTAAGATTLLLARQAELLGPAPGSPPSPLDPLAALVRRSEHAALTDRTRWGDLWWLLQGACDIS